MEPCDLLVRGAAQLVTMDGPAPTASDPHSVAPLGLCERGALAAYRGRVVALGPEREVLSRVRLEAGGLELDARGGVLAPGLVDAHTHALFVGQRAGEFGARLRGESYAQVAARGGGIAASVRRLRAAQDAELDAELEARLVRMRSFGVTCAEVKTGYGLDTASELRSLRALARASAKGLLHVVRTALPLHAVDPALRAEPEGRARFLERTLRETLPALLAEGPDFVDAYVDSTGFSVAECEPALRLARAAGVGVRLHVGQFDEVGGALLAARLGAASADHLEHVSDEGLAAMAAAGVVGVLLPGAAFSLGQSMPDARRMRAAGLEVAVATDCNPGTSHTENLPLMAALAVRGMGLTQPEAWWALTRAPARSLRREGLGALRVGGPADACVLGWESWEALGYDLGSPCARAVLLAGRLVHGG